ncbi:MAG: multicomponent K+:H+ antiporter subunit PhaE [Rhodobacteraceae bacterium HLUCCA12]|nr:MAG: multicomponent K+:H+ antiporter subunit PhaE [Rhodobacteraceae bacterium HLUCCA12]
MTLFHKVFPHPVLSLSLVVIWVLLVNTVTLNAVVFGAILGLVLPQLTRAYWPNAPRLRSPLRIAGYVLVVLWDIVVANVEVALIILFKPEAARRPNWVTIPLELRSPEAITVLAGTITMTPGTVSCDLAENGHAILVHCLHAPDPDAVRDQIKHRYERRLKEIFE